MRRKGEINSEKEFPDHSDEPEGLYANTFKVGYNAYEFVIDFGQSFDEKGKEKFNTRIITNPKDIKYLYDLIGKSIDKYES